MAKEILCAYGVDVDAVAGWIGSYGGAEFSRRHLARHVRGRGRVPRLLDLFDRHGMKTTWFIPGHSIETFPDQTTDGGRRGPRDRRARLHARKPDRNDPRAGGRQFSTGPSTSSQKCRGKRPNGYVAPWWEFSPVTIDLLIEQGIKYDHSPDAQRLPPYYVRVGDTWTNIDYSKSA